MHGLYRLFLEPFGPVRRPYRFEVGLLIRRNRPDERPSGRVVVEQSTVVELCGSLGTRWPDLNEVFHHVRIPERQITRVALLRHGCQVVARNIPVPYWALNRSVSIFPGREITQARASASDGLLANASGSSCWSVNPGPAGRIGRSGSAVSVKARDSTAWKNAIGWTSIGPIGGSGGGVVKSGGRTCPSEASKVCALVSCRNTPHATIPSKLAIARDWREERVPMG